MSVTYNELRSFSPGTWTSQAQKWGVNALQSVAASQELRMRAAEVRKQWTGPVGALMAASLEERADDLMEHAEVYKGIAEVLNEGAAMMVKLQQQVAKIEQKANANQLEVDYNGDVNLSDDAKKLPFMQQVRLWAFALALARAINDCLSSAGQIDSAVAAALAQRADIDWPIPSDVGPIDLSDNAIRRQLTLSSQGALGDCAWLATLRSIANANPERIRENCVWDPDTQTYKVTIYDPATGWPRTIDVDPDSLADASHDAHDPNKVNFLMIYEQALLQVDPAFDSTNFTEASKMILGRDVVETQSDNTPTSEIRDTLNDDPPGAAMVATSGAEEQPDNVAPEKRMVPNHAYQVVSVDAQGNITLANPWGPQGGTGAGGVDYPGTVTLTPDEYRKWCNGVMQVDNP